MLAAHKKTDIGWPKAMLLVLSLLLFLLLLSLRLEPALLVFFPRVFA